MASPISIACIGCGFIARIHLLNARQIPELAVFAFADVHEDVARQFYDEFGGRYYTTDSARILKDEQIDAVLICTWHDTHLPLALQAAHAGKHILIEKPMAMTSDDCLRIEEAVTRAGVKLMVDFKFRFAPTVQTVKETIGRPFLTVGQSVCDRPATAETWVLDPQKGGGLLLSGGVHNFDLMCYFNDAEPVRVYAEGGTYIFQDSPFIDNVVATITFANGAIGSFVQGMGRKSQYASTWFFEVFGAEKTATLYDHCRQAEICEETVKTLSIREQCAEPNAVGTLELLRAFTRCILDDTEPDPGPRDGTRATLLVEKAQESLRTGQPQTITMAGQS